MALRAALNRYLALEGFPRTRRHRPGRSLSGSSHSRGSDGLTQAVVVINGHKVSVIEDEAGVVQLQEK